MLIVILVITLLPFRFQWPAHFSIAWYIKPFDVIANVGLFLPLGFLYRLARSNRSEHGSREALIVGLLLSTCIELLQLFLRGRFSSPVDVLTNGIGAWIGAVLCGLIEKRLRTQMVGVLALELPLMNVVYLLLPLLWLNALTAGNHLERLLLAPLLGLCGGFIITAIWLHRLRPAGIVSTPSLFLLLIVWFLFGSILAVRIRPELLVFYGLGVIVMVWLQTTLKFSFQTENRRFELPTLRWVWPLFILYLILLAFWPWPWQWPRWWHPGTWRVAVGLIEYTDTPGVIPVLRLIEYIAACTLLGYLVAESRGRLRQSFTQALLKVSLWCGAIVGIIEIGRGFHPYHTASLAQFCLALGAGLYGGIVYELQLQAVQQLVKIGHRLEHYRQSDSGQTPYKQRDL